MNLSKSRLQNTIVVLFRLQKVKVMNGMSSFSRNNSPRSLLVKYIHYNLFNNVLIDRKFEHNQPKKAYTIEIKKTNSLCVMDLAQLRSSSSFVEL